MHIYVIKVYSEEMGAKGFIMPVKGHKKERVMGIEPTYPAWKAGVLPLNYTREQDVSYHHRRQKARTF